jgi:hypothetical protein
MPIAGVHLEYRRTVVVAAAADLVDVAAGVESETPQAKRHQ